MPIELSIVKLTPQPILKSRSRLNPMSFTIKDIDAFLKENFAVLPQEVVSYLKTNEIDSLSELQAIKLLLNVNNLDLLALNITPESESINPQVINPEDYEVIFITSNTGLLDLASKSTGKKDNLEADKVALDFIRTYFSEFPIKLPPTLLLEEVQVRKSFGDFRKLDIAEAYEMLERAGIKILFLVS